MTNTMRVCNNCKELTRSIWKYKSYFLCFRCYRSATTSNSRFSFSYHKGQIKAPYKLVKLVKPTIKELKEQISCYGTREYSDKAGICRNCELKSRCKVVFPKKFRVVKNGLENN